jgi:hypothetical protein
MPTEARLLEKYCKQDSTIAVARHITTLGLAPLAPHATLALQISMHRLSLGILQHLPAGLSLRLALRQSTPIAVDTQTSKPRPDRLHHAGVRRF